MKIMLVPPYDWKSGRGGAEAFARRLHDLINAAGLESVSISENDCDWINEVIYDLPIWRNTPQELFRKINLEYLGVAQFIVRLQEKNFDIIHVLNWAPAWFLLAFTQIPTIISLHQIANDDLVVKGIKAVIGLPNTTIIAPSSLVRDSYTQKGIKIHHVIPPIFNPQAPIKRSGAVNPIRLLWVGRITDIKSPTKAIQIAKALNLPLSLVGPIEDPIYFEKEVQPLLVPDRILYLGQKKWLDMPDLLEEVMAVLITSEFPEAFSYVALEAINAGLPVITTTRIGVQEYLSAGQQYILPWTSNCDPGALIEHLRELRLRQVSPLSEKEKSRFEGAFEEYIALYRERSES